jgi:3-isopropylmalate/(R)-2-methylmalate dehydratase small subunit
LKNSLLPVAVPKDIHVWLFANPDAVVKIDLASQALTLPDGRRVEFPVDSFSKHCLLEGIDELGYILQQAPAIEGYEARHPAVIDTLA